MERCSVDRDALLGPGATLRRLMGLWPLQGSGAERLCSALLGGFSLLFIACPVLSAGLKLYMDPPRKIEETALSCFVAFICSVMWIKVALFIGQRDTLLQLVDLLTVVRNLYNNGEGNEYTRRRYHRLIQRVYLFLQAAAVPALMGWVSSPLLSHSVHGGDHPSPDSKRQLPVSLWLPMEVHTSPTYEILYVAQSIGLTIAAESTVCIDIFFFHMMLVIGAELEVLNENISAVHKLRKETGKSKRRDYIYEYQATSETTMLSCDDSYTAGLLEQRLQLQLVDNIQHHQTILSSICLLQTTMSVSVFVLLFINMANLCANIFVTAVLLQRDGNITKALKALLAIPPVLYETGMYCMFGHIVTGQSEKLMQSAFSCGWTECDVRFRRSVLIFMTTTVRPVEITVGKMTKLSKQTLLQVLNGTYALLNLLYHFHSSV
ncbi:odorant receptor 43a-like [Schistocerca gregaria]|uniref:odorant receptor 43a-like n=1 Tax=Schistocerca gregaria TaxID=7010 RepID=UPI00211F39B8|nr:odorant receptor 43a-like [Schistocerca gregaria]